MKARKLRVLLDLSMGLLGYCGIAQDVRLLYKTLASSPDVDLTGMIYPPFSRTMRHRFAKPSAPHADRIANQSCFLWGLNEGPPSLPYPRPVRMLLKAAYAASRATTRSAQFEPLVTSKLWPTVWRSMFRQTLSASDIPLVENGQFVLANMSADAIFMRVMAGRRPIQLDTSNYDFVITQTARPFNVSPGTQHIVRYHDMIPITQPDTMLRTMDIEWHHRSIRQCRDSFFICNSEPTRENLVDVYPELMDRAATVPYMLSNEYWPDGSASQVRSIIAMRRSLASGVGPRRPLKNTPRYLMCVSTIEPRKNFTGLVQAFNILRARQSIKRAAPDLKLIIVGGPGWKYEPILHAMREPIAAGHVIHLEKVTSEELRVLYTHAEAFVFPSNAEGFGFPPLEAMQCDLPVIASDIAEHRWVLGDAALYCNSYDVNTIADAVEQLVASEEAPALRRELVARGRRRVERYSLDQCRDQWMDLLSRLRSGERPLANVPPATTPFVRDSKERAA
jgi:glycosyltransferase involved in cell wall biosynthesis